MKKSSKYFSEQLTWVKDNCKKQLVEILTKNDQKIFDLVDPLLSDNQCQIHSIFILNILLKCYRYEERSFDVKLLQDDDMDILSEAVLLTFIKIEQIDAFGIQIRQESLENFGGYVCSKKMESKFLAQTKENFNSKSVEFIRKIAKKSVKQILDNCTATIPHSKIKLKVLPCYPTVYAMMTYIKEKGLPIVVGLKRIELRKKSFDVKYRVNSVDIFYYKWDGVKFQCKENLTECELKQPCITFDSYSLYDIDSSSLNHENYVEKFKFPSNSFFVNCDIGHMIMASLSTHFQLSESKELTINAGYHSSDDYIHSIYKNSSTKSQEQCFSVDSQFESNNTNVYEQYLAHVRLAEDINCKNSQYARFHKCMATRRTQNTFFGVRHARVSNYFKEYSKKLRWNTDAQLEQIEVFPDVNRDAAAITILKKLGMTEK